ncbi:unnamed protein product [Ceutorhynchus assimilis]|uniref:Protein arginine N-methyltransferase n=1 Tax=Ceutorhynchus assimilis TaxID=467358 RepID=A0A9N9MJJ3_9CUCU|nr:unnamed protein product [Ceutorhynchus assimilis]
MESNDQHSDASSDKRKKMSCGLYFDAPKNLKEAIEMSINFGYHFLVTQLTHPSLVEDFDGPDAAHVIGRTDRILKAVEWNRLILGELSTSTDVDSEDIEIQKSSRATLEQELGFASHLGLPAILIYLTKPKNIQLARIINERLVLGLQLAVWVQIPIVHVSRENPMGESEHDTWDWWNDFRTYCDYDKRLRLVLEMPSIKNCPTSEELDRWIGEPVKALFLRTSQFLKNQFGKPVLPKSYQNIIQRFMALDVQYIIYSDTEDSDLGSYSKYINFLGKKLYFCNNMADFIEGCEDYLQNPLQPLTEHLESTVYEVFERDATKYINYENAVLRLLKHWKEPREPVIMVVGAGRGPLVQAVLDVSKTLDLKCKVYAIEKNPYAMNTLVHRNKYEWDSQVTLVKTDMRSWEAPELADVLVSELLGSFGDNELSPECLDGAQKFLNPKTGVSIPSQYTSFIAPIQSTKIFNEIRDNRMPDKTLKQSYETPYVVHLNNFYQLAPPEALFVFDHPNFTDCPDNKRYKSIRFPPISKAAVLTGFAGFFETVLLDEGSEEGSKVMLSTNPETHTPDMVSWFPIVFSLAVPVQLKAGDVVRVSFWREENFEKVWYEWCLESPCRTPIMNVNGRSYSLKKK